MNLSLLQVGISRKNILHNLHEYQRAYPKLAIAPVIKSNAYGHGLLEVAKILQHETTPCLVVNSLDEALRLRSAKIKSGILIAGYVRPSDLRHVPSKTVVTIVDIEQLKAIKSVKKPLRVSIKIDTGMHRQGILPDDFDIAITYLKSAEKLSIEAICTHLADGDGETTTFTEKQISEWNASLQRFAGAFPSMSFRHMSATTGFEFTSHTHTNMARLGIGLYGFDAATAKKMRLKPVMELRSIVASIRTLDAGESVGYNATFTAKRRMKIATVPGGYFEGLDRRLSNKGTVIIRKKSCPIVGRVSMNMIGADVSHLPRVSPDETVILISRDPDDSNSVENIARIIGTIPYEVVTRVPSELPRIIE